MPEISPFRVAAYAALAAVLLLVGWNSLRSEGGPEPGSTAAAGPSAPAEPNEPSGSGLQINSGTRRIVVDVSGAVKRPGVYGFRHGERVIDAIRRAGGTTRDAVPGAINRAALLADGQQVVVPSGSAAAAAPGTDGAVAGAAEGAEPDAPISLGTATQAELEEIEGIGPVTAQSILEFRDSRGGISSIDELDQVSGIGPVTMEALRSRLQP
jgi:competence protein ComEA